MKQTPLCYGHFYHIYNRGINSCKLFRETTNYEHFLGLYDHHISPVADTFAWVLMGNHFHLLVKIKPEEEIGFIPLKNKTPEGRKDASGLEKTFGRLPDPEAFRTERETPEGRKDASGLENLSASLRPESIYKPKKYKPENQFSHLFNAYTKAFNKKYNRTGSLFEHPFSRIKITSNAHLKYLVYYIHHNPIHHGFCEHYLDYPWSSYLTILSPKKTRLKRNEVLGWYNQADHFKQYHNKESIEKFSELHIDNPY